MTAAWFGTADAPSLLLTVLAFVFVARTRYLPAAACIAGAVLLKQFALIALPFLAVMMLTQGAARRVLWQAALFAVIVAVGILPFAVWDLGALWDDTIAYGAQTYRIIGYGLAGVLLEIGVLDDRFGPTPSCRLPPSCGYPLRRGCCGRSGALAGCGSARRRSGRRFSACSTLAAFSRTRT